MVNSDKINLFKSMTKEELRLIAMDKTSSEEDMVIASIELGLKEKAEGNFFTTQEVFKNIFGESYLVNRC